MFQMILVGHKNSKMIKLIKSIYLKWSEIRVKYQKDWNIKTTTI